MASNFLISILCFAAGGLVGWIILNPKLLRARSEAAAVNAALEIAKAEIVTLQSDVEGAGKQITTLQSELEAAREKLNEVEKEKRRSAQEPLSQDEFRTKLFGIIDAEVNSLLESKQTEALGYPDALKLTASIRGIFAQTIRVVPEEIDYACTIAEAFLAPTRNERIKLLKKAAKMGGVAGIGLILVAILTAVGLPSGVIGVIWVFLVGPHFPLGLALAGVTLTMVAAYFAVTGNPKTDTERFMKALKSGLREAIKKVWTQHGEKLSRWHPKIEDDDRGTPSMTSTLN